MLRGLEAGAIVESRYRLDSFLGSGSAGQVWAATDLQTQRPVALKLLHQAGLHRTRREAEALGRLQHPAVVRLLGIGEHGDVPYLVLELVQGENLRINLARRALEGRPFAADELINLLAPILGALGEAHDRDVIHRDLKPENLILDLTGRLRILDFGVARLIDGPLSAATTHGRMLGTLFYFSPEQSLGQVIGPASDLFSLAVIAFECLTLRRPWARDRKGHLISLVEPAELNENTAVQVVARITGSERPKVHPLAPWLGPKVDDFFGRALAVDPSQRPADARSFAKELAAGLAEARTPEIVTGILEITASNEDWGSTTTNPGAAAFDQSQPPRFPEAGPVTTWGDARLVEAVVEESPAAIVPTLEVAPAVEEQELAPRIARSTLRPGRRGPWIALMLALGLSLGLGLLYPNRRVPLAPTPDPPPTLAPEASAKEDEGVPAEVEATHPPEVVAPADAQAKTKPLAKKTRTSRAGPKPNEGSHFRADLEALKSSPDPVAFRRLLAAVRKKGATIGDPSLREEIERLVFLASETGDLAPLERAIARLEIAG